MGPSGGGKTSFLNVLGGRVKMEAVTGLLTYNDQPYSKTLKRRWAMHLYDSFARQGLLLIFSHFMLSMLPVSFST